jgi:hypothetical protein
MKGMAVCLVALLVLLSAAAAQTQAPASFQNPSARITPNSCIVYRTCSPNGATAKELFEKELLDGDWLRFFERDVGNLLASGQAFVLEGRIGSDGKVICTMHDVEVPDTPNIVVVEFWDPTCSEKPTVCTKYNGNIVQVNPQTEYAYSKDYIFVDTSGNSYFRGAGFYASCGPETQTLGSYTSTVEKIIVAGNSPEAVQNTAKTFAKALEKSKPSAYDSGLKYHVTEDWATTAIVYFFEDQEAAFKARDSVQKGMTKTPLMIRHEDIGTYQTSASTIAAYLMSPGGNRPGLFNVKWINPAASGTVKLIASAEPAFRELAKNNEPTVPLLMFSRLNSDSPRKITPAIAYGCKPKGTDLGTIIWTNEAGETEELPHTSTGLDFRAETPFALTYTAGSASSSNIFVVKDRGNMYAGYNGLVCSFADRLAGSCTAIIQQSQRLNKNPPEVAALLNVKKKYYCGTTGNPSGNFFEGGVYWDYNIASGGKVEFISGFVPCATYGLVVEGGEYFTSTFRPNQRQYMPTCEEVKSAYKGVAMRCPYDYGSPYVNTKGLLSTKYCACVDENTTAYDQMSGIAARVASPTPLLPSPVPPEPDDDPEPEPCGEDERGRCITSSDCPSAYVVSDGDCRTGKTCCDTSLRDEDAQKCIDDFGEGAILCASGSPNTVGSVSSPTHDNPNAYFSCCCKEGYEAKEEDGTRKCVREAETPPAPQRDRPPASQAAADAVARNVPLRGTAADEAATAPQPPSPQTLDDGTTVDVEGGATSVTTPDGVVVTASPGSPTAVRLPAEDDDVVLDNFAGWPRALLPDRTEYSYSGNGQYIKDVPGTSRDIVTVGEGGLEIYTDESMTVVANQDGSIEARRPEGYHPGYSAAIASSGATLNSDTQQQLLVSRSGTVTPNPIRVIVTEEGSPAEGREVAMQIRTGSGHIIRSCTTGGDGSCQISLGPGDAIVNTHAFFNVDTFTYASIRVNEILSSRLVELQI